MAGKAGIMEKFNQTAREKLQENSHLNLPDLKFFHRCQQMYHINRGVFNAIDQWFYEYGIIHILSRRIYILAFLDYVKESHSTLNSQKFMKFGPGGLKKALDEFLRSQHSYFGS